MTERLWPGQERVLHATLDDVSPEALRLLFGMDPGGEQEDDPTFTAQARGWLLRRPVAPRKRRGLTGKRYRIARRRYAREMHDYRRGVGERVEVHYYVPRASVDARAYQTFTAKAAATYDVAFRPALVSPRDAKPGYGEGS